MKKALTIIAVLVTLVLVAEALTLLLPFSDEGPITKEKCSRASVMSRAQYSEHIGFEEIFWSSTFGSCLAVTQRAMEAGSDWAIEYMQQTNLPFLSEGYTYTLYDLNKQGDSAVALKKTYSYQSLEDYLENQDSPNTWKSDFLAQVQRYK